MSCEQIPKPCTPQKCHCMLDSDLETGPELKSMGEIISPRECQMKESFLLFNINTHDQRFCGQIRPQLFEGPANIGVGRYFHIAILPRNLDFNEKNNKIVSENKIATMVFLKPAFSVLSHPKTSFELNSITKYRLRSFCCWK
jgi:hypothetical protein